MLRQVVPGLHIHVGTLGTSSGIAAFDLDGTLIRSIRGKFPKDPNDWAFLPNRIPVLKAYKDANYTLVIFTNQGYKGDKLINSINRINNIITALVRENINPWILAATGDSLYRKPNTGMWDVFAQYNNEARKGTIPINIDKSRSFYVGDAAGRPQDHSNDDIAFAKNIGLPFYTPEAIFPNNQVQIPNTQTMFIFVGMPGSGKTSYYEQNLQPKGWVYVNQDILKTQPKMINAVTTALVSGKSVAVDATNPNPDKRREYIMLAAQYKIPTLIIYFVRDGHGWNNLRPHPVPTVAYNMYYKNLVEPTPELDLVPVVEIF
jgi:bifunctional polynucleotide phosphatase/kinase